MRLLDPVNDTGRIPWCGPSALATVTGKPLSTFMPYRRGRMKIGEVVYLLREHGYWPRVVSSASHGLRSFGPLWKALPPGALGIARVPGHLIAFHGKMVRCPKVDRAVWVFDHPDFRRKTTHLIILDDGGPRS